MTENEKNLFDKIELGCLAAEFPWLETFLILTREQRRAAEAAPFGCSREAVDELIAANVVLTDFVIEIGRDEIDRFTALIHAKE